MHHPDEHLDFGDGVDQHEARKNLNDILTGKIIHTPKDSIDKTTNTQMPFEDPVPEMPDIDNTGKHAAEYKKYISAVKLNINKALAE